ncbi:hypothetical protein AB9F29_20240 [Falsihalocynthiibacter sp. S25ZX9]|uniref:hypothetical protein n=1 Tax=Falsihalocynthiibacter sp. S25ZX9 TaxID=3240870 RepID=UPI00351072E4
MKRLLLSVCLLGLLVAPSAQAAVTVSDEKAKFIAPPPTPLEASVARALKSGDTRPETIKLFLPWHHDVYQIGPYELTWAASPTKRGKAIQLTEIYWAYNYSGKSYSSYPGLDNFITNAPWKHAAEYGTTLQLDYTNPNFADYIANVAAERAKQFHAKGVFLDWWTNKHPSALSEAKIGEARRKIAQSIRDRNGPNFLIVGNTNWQFDRSTHDLINGVYLEMIKKQKGPYSSSEIETVEKLLEFHDEYLSEPKIVALEMQRITLDKSERDRNSAVNNRYAKLFSAMNVVVPRNGFFIYTDNNRDSATSDHLHTYYEIYRTKLGNPKSARTKISDGIAYKLFDKGVVLYNWTNQAASVGFGKAGTVHIDAHEGAFCEFTTPGRLSCK